MALGGVLRAALKAGNWARAAAESRRQARALRQFSPEFGSGRKTSAEDFLRRRGVDVDAMLAPRTGNPYMDWVADFDGPRGYYADSPFGGVVQGSVRDGVERRFRPAPEMYSPIVSPYEGGRAWPNPVGFGPQSFDAPPPWVGRGPATPVRRFDAYSDGMSEYPFGGIMPEQYRFTGGEQFDVFEPMVPFENGQFIRRGDINLGPSAFFWGRTRGEGYPF